MNLFVKRFIAFFLILVVFDFIAGLGIKLLVKNAKGGDTARNEFIINKVKSPILIFGSSRGMCAYNSQIISKMLGMQCYNCANDGMGIILFWNRFQLIKRRYIPKMIIYDVWADFDLRENVDVAMNLDALKLYYDYPEVKETFQEIDPMERYKMICRLYRYNGKILQILTDNLKPARTDILGWRPKYGFMNYEPIGDGYYSKMKYDKLKLLYMQKLIEQCKKNKIKLIFMLSPFYKGVHNVTEIYAPLISLCKKYQIPFYNFSSDKNIANNKYYFVDSYHLNVEGATVYSKKISLYLKSKKDFYYGK